MGLEEEVKVECFRNALNTQCTYNAYQKQIMKLRKEFIMNKKKLFALVMCAMLIVSSMAVWAASSKEIGVGNEKATCYLDISNATAIAKTTPVYSGNSCQTTIQLYTSQGADNSASGSTSVSVRQSGPYAITRASSTHRCGSAYGTLTDLP